MEKIKNVNITEYQSNDFYLSACILSAKIPLKRLDRAGRLFTFIFDSPPQVINGIIQRHWGRDLLIPTRDLIEAINELKTRIHSGI